MTLIARSALAILLWTVAGTSVFAQGYLSGLDSNKKVVFDFYRLVFEPRNADLVPQYIAEDFIEHNPRFQSGRENFVKTLKSLPAPASDEIGDKLRNPPALIIAEGDLVTYIFKRNTPDPKDKTKTYEAFWFDTFRIKDRKIVEHWDAATK
jgi:predicted SnoaL-like aldol condensation-catalyzing enzyme